MSPVPLLKGDNIFDAIFLLISGILVFVGFKKAKGVIPKINSKKDTEFFWSIMLSYLIGFFIGHFITNILSAVIYYPFSFSEYTKYVSYWIFEIIMVSVCAIALSYYMIKRYQRER